MSIFLESRIGIQYFRKYSAGWGRTPSDYAGAAFRADDRQTRCAPARSSPRSSRSTPSSSPSPRSSPRSSRATGCQRRRPARGPAAARPRRRQRRAAQLAAAARAAWSRWSRLVQTMERVDLASPGQRADAPRRAPPREVQRLTAGLQPHARPPRGGAPRGRPRRPARPGGGARADRAGPPRRGQPGADRDPAAPAGRRCSDAPPGLRAELKEIQTLATQAMEELLHAGPPAAPDRARRPRPRRPRSPRRSPTSASAPASRARFHRHGDVAARSPTRSSSCSTASRRRACPTSSSTRGAQRASTSSFVRRPHRAAHPRRRPRLRPAPATATRRAAGLGVSGMRERALLVGGRLNIFSAPGEGTTIELTMGAT